MAYKTKYTVKNKEKYCGDPNNVISRSNWERQVMIFLDNDPRVLKWASEEIHILYVHPKDKRVHKYKPDFLVKIRDKDNQDRIYLLEVKPHRETIEPKITKNKSKKTLLTERLTYEVNKAKFESAKRYCDLKGWKFLILSEKNTSFIK